MSNRIHIDPERTLAPIDRNLFGGFAEHLGRCVYGGMYDPASPLADERGLRADVLAALRRLRMPLIRYPGGNFVSGYRWRDGVGPLEERPARYDMAWHTVESNHFGTNEFIHFCRQLGTEPYLVVNCGDGDLREARDWVEYCNGAQETALVRLRREHGFEQPHNVRYWGVGNEVDGHWQIGYKTPQEYARAFTEFGKVMKWTDPNIKLIAAALSDWNGDIVERGRLILEQAGDLVDYLALHWYVDNPQNDFAAYMALSELFEERLSAYEGLIRAVCLDRKIRRPIAIAVDEWNTWHQEVRVEGHDVVVYNLEDALVTGLHFNAFIRHARTVKMATIAQIVNTLAPILTRPDGLVLQTIFYPFELYSRCCGDVALDAWWSGDTFSGGEYSGVRVLDVSATFDTPGRRLVLFVVNRSQQSTETEIALAAGRFAGPGQAIVVNGPDIKAENTFDLPNRVGAREVTFEVGGGTFHYTFEPHSVTALLCPVAR